MAKLTVDNSIVTKYSGNVTELIIPDGITKIADPKSYGDKGIFEGHSELTSVVLPEGLLRIGERAFEDCIGLTDIVIPVSVKEIGKSAFRGCKGLTNITIPDNVRIIEEKSFSGCSELLTVVISENAEKIEDSAFAGCANLMKVNIPYNVNEIRYSAFEDCSSLRSIIFPDNQLKIGSYVFRNCSELTEVTIPDSVKYYSDSFKGCKKIIINGEKLFIKDSELVNFAGFSPDVVIPESVKYIGDEAFADHSEIISVTIPNSVEKIGSGAFKNCSGLRNITIPGSVTEIGSSAFKGCSSLKSINIPESVNKIEGWTFEGCSELSDIILPSGISEIKSGTFRNCSCMTNVIIPNSVTKIDLTAFNGCSSLHELNIPASIKNIGCGWNLEKINRIIIAPDSIIERIFYPEELLKYEYDISPVPMIPISAILEPENKIKFFFEYCKGPEKYPQHIADEYEKYGRSQRSRILREAEKQNRAEVIAFYEKKGKKAAVRTLTPAEKAVLMKDALEKGSDEDLLRVLKKYKNIGCEPSMLEKAICEGKTSKVQILLDSGISVPERSNCFSELLKSTAIPFDVKKIIIEQCLSQKESKITVDTDCVYEILTASSISYDEKKAVVELCLSHDLLRDNIDLCYAACVLNDREIISLLESYGKFPQYLPQSGWFPYTDHYRFFANLSAEQCRNALDNLLSHSDPKIKPKFYMDKTDAPSIFYPDIMRFVIEHFTIKWGNWPGKIILNAVKNNQPESLKMLLDLLEDNKQNMLDDISDSEYLRQAIVECVSQQSNDMLGILYDTGWADPVIKKKEEYFHENRGWKTKLFNDAILSGNPVIIETLISYGLLSELPSSFNKTNALRLAICADNPGALDILEKQGWIRNSSIRDGLIDTAVNEDKKNALAWLLDYKNKTSNPVKEEKAREQKEQRALKEDHPKSESIEISDAKAINKDAWKTTKNPDGTYSIVQYKEDDSYLIIPAKIGRRTITAITKRTFSDVRWDSDAVIRISEGIKEIEDETFADSRNLVAVVIPESVISIGTDAFRDCERLVIYGKMGSYAEKFAAASGLNFCSTDDCEKPIPDFVIGNGTLTAYLGKEKNPVIPKGVLYIGDSVFRKRSDLECVYIPEGVKSIGHLVFEGCSSLRSITIPDSLERIGGYAFSGCKMLAEIRIPNSVVTIGEHAFYECYGLKNIKLSANLAKIGSCVFWGCQKLTNISIPNSVTEIGDYAFAFCSDLVDITIPEGVISIGHDAFTSCSGLRNITIPSSVINIGFDAFEGCNNLMINGKKYWIKNNDLIFYTGQDSDVIIPDGIEDIHEKAFKNHREIITLHFPDSLTRIGIYAFQNCSGIKNLSIPKGVEIIEKGAFDSCRGLTSILLPDNIKTIKEGAFKACVELSSITIPEGITSIERETFAWCSKLTSVTIPKSVSNFGKDVFYGFDKKDLVLYVHENSAALQYAKDKRLKYKVIENE